MGHAAPNPSCATMFFPGPWYQLGRFDAMSTRASKQSRGNNGIAKITMQFGSTTGFRNRLVKPLVELLHQETNAYLQASNW